MLSVKVLIIHVIVGEIKNKSLYKMSFFFQEQCFLSKWKIKVELNLSNYPKKSDSKEATDIDTEKLA